MDVCTLLTALIHIGHGCERLKYPASPALAYLDSIGISILR